MAAARLTFQCLDIVKKREVSCLIYNILGYLCYRVLHDGLQKKRETVRSLLVREQWPWEISPLATTMRPDWVSRGRCGLFLTSLVKDVDSKVQVFPSPKFLTTSFGLFRRDDEWGCQISSSLSRYPQPGGPHVNRPSRWHSVSADS